MIEFQELYRKHNGERYLTPEDLSSADVKPRRALIVGSCLADVWQSKIDCPCDFVMTNGLNQLPETPPHPIQDYDLQLIQIPLRFVVPDETLWKLDFPDLKSYEDAFDISLQRLRQYLFMASAWNAKHGILTFVANLLVPQQNAMGRFAPRYDLRNPVYFIEQLNFHLVKELEAYKNTYLLDIDAISGVFGKRYIQDDAVEIQTHGSLLGNSNYEYDGDRVELIQPMTQHYELHRDVFIAAIWHQAAAMYKTMRQDDMVKLVIVDLDHTLWRGVVAEGGGDINDQTIEGWPLGLIEALVFLKKRGVMLAIASKNEEERIKKLWPDIMRGRFSLEDFVAVRINWKPKAENIEEILKFVNVLPRHTVFIDDNPVERAAVQGAFPDMRVLGKYPYYLKRILLWSPETQVPVITSESANRTEMMQAQAKREIVRKEMSRDEFLATLNLQVSIAEITSAEHPRFARAFELINRTNQYNTTGRRWTREECDGYFKAGNIFYSFDAKDRFSSYGTVGCALVAGHTIDQFVMSCRVLGLDIEMAVVHVLEERMHSRGATEMRARLVETKDNFPCRDLYQKCGFQKTGDEWVKAL